MEALVAPHQSSRIRTIHACAVQTREAMKNVTTALCQKVIAHCHAWLGQFMASEQDGSLQQFVSLINTPAQQLKADDVTSLPATPAQEDEDEQDEASWTQ
jgi:hypothetical protein